MRLMVASPVGAEMQALRSKPLLAIGSKQQTVSMVGTSLRQCASEMLRCVWGKAGGPKWAALGVWERQWGSTVGSEKVVTVGSMTGISRKLKKVKELMVAVLDLAWQRWSCFACPASEHLPHLPFFFSSLSHPDPYCCCWNLESFPLHFTMLSLLVALPLGGHLLMCCCHARVAICLMVARLWMEEAGGVKEVEEEVVGVSLSTAILIRWVTTFI